MIVERNNIKLDFLPDQVSKGTNVGAKFFNFDVTKDNYQDVIEFLGEEAHVAILRAKVRQLSKTLSDRATTLDAAGQPHFDQEKFVASMANLATESESIPELMKKQTLLTEELDKLNFSASDPAEIGKVMMEAKRINEQLRLIRFTIAEKRRVPAKSEDEE